MKLTYYGTVTPSGEIKLPGAKMRKEAAAFAGKEIECTIQKRKKRRSSPQNRYYHGVVVEMVRIGIKDAWGEVLTAEEAHDLLKWRFLRTLKADENGELIAEIPGSTTKLSTSEFSEYVEKCCQFAAEFLGVSIPLPE